MSRTTAWSRRGDSSGFSLVELMIAVTILASVLGMMTMLGQANQRAYSTGALRAQLELQIGSTVDRLVVELSAVGRETLVPAPIPPSGTSAIEYRQAVDIVDGQVVWTPRRRLAFEYDPAELDDGLDNNGNGLVDEGQIVLTEDLAEPTERRLVLTRWVPELAEGELANGIDDNGDGRVDEPGFLMWPEGESLYLRLSLHKPAAEGRFYSRPATTSVRLRN